VTDVDQQKQAVRERIWSLLERERAAPTGVHGRIPNFVGADRAALRLAELSQWQAARVVKAVPDAAQTPVRTLALEQGKDLYMAVPKLAEPKPFYYLEPRVLPVSAAEAADKRTAARVGRHVGVEDMQPIDLIVCGSVAVNRHGVRLGKGAGYSDIEVALLQEAGLIGPETTIVTTVHRLQVVDENLPETDHDFSVDLIVTPDEVVHCGPPRRPQGMVWEKISDAQIEAMPVLAAMKARTQSA
jgi:5-formyltetrahydrofolate cyclo-ligase